MESNLDIAGLNLPEQFKWTVASDFAIEKASTALKMAFFGDQNDNPKDHSAFGRTQCTRQC